jgi:cytochrome c-type biogenesis protein
VIDSVGVAIALTAGLLSFLSPCVLPLVPSYLSFVTGMTLDDLQDSGRRTHVLAHSLLFVSGFTAVFMVLGATASFLGRFAHAYEDWIARVGGVLIIVLGLHLLGVFRIAHLMREARVHLSDKPAGYMGTIAVGAAFGAGWTPCIGPVLGGILTLAGTRETVWSGVWLLFVYSVGLAVPFLLAALALNHFLATFRRFRSWIPWMERAAGLLLVLLGVMLLTGSFTLLTTWLNQFTPQFILDRI